MILTPLLPELRRLALALGLLLLGLALLTARPGATRQPPADPPDPAARRATVSELDSGKHKPPR